MDDTTFQDVYNYIRVSDHIATGGQPTEAQLAAIAEAGCTTVVNLGLHDADYALPDEPGVVASLGMAYVHIPVLWEQPTRADLEQFCDVLRTLEGKDIFVHCAANVRVSVFVALDRILHQGWNAQEALKGVGIHELPKVWQTFVESVAGKQG